MTNQTFPRQTVWPFRRLAALVLVLLVAALPIAVRGAPLAQEVFYQEDFESGAAPDWQLDPGWQVALEQAQKSGAPNHVLAGQGHTWARFNQPMTGDASGFSDYRLAFRLKVLAGSVHLVYRLSSVGRYFVDFAASGSSLHKQYFPNEFHDGLAGSSRAHSLGAWHQVEIDGAGNKLTFYVDGKPEWTYTDPKPLQAGSFAFETLDNASVEVDDIVVALGAAPTPFAPLAFATPVSGTAASPLTWVRLGGPLGGLGYDVRMRPDNPDRMYVTDAWSGVFASDDGGQTWAPASQGISVHTGSSGEAIPVFCLTVDPRNPDTVWAGTQNLRGIYKSTDGGKTWTMRVQGIVGTQGITFRGFTVDPSNSDIVYAAAELSSWTWNNGQPRNGREFDMTEGVVYKTTDGGASWQAVWRGKNLARYIWIDPGDTQVLYVSTGIFDREAANSDPQAGTPGGEGVLKSVDGGKTWKNINQGLDNLYVGSLFMQPAKPGVLLAGTGNNQYRDGSGAYLTEDGGATWKQTLKTAPDPIEAVEFSAANPQIAYAAGAAAVYRSEDGGHTWQQVTTGAGGWGPPGVLGGFPIDLQADPRNPDRLFANAYGGGNFLSVDGGKTWTDASRGYTGAQVRAIAVQPRQAGVVIAAARSGLFVSQDGGSQWQGLNYAPLNVMEWNAIAIDPANPQHLLAGTNWGNRLVESLNGGLAWSVVQEFPDDRISWRTIVFAPSAPSTVYAGTAGYYSAGTFSIQPGHGIYLSTDGGHTWQPANDANTGDAHVTGLAVDPGSPQVVYAATLNHGLFKTSDGGKTWQGVNGGWPQDGGLLSVAIDPADPKTVFVGAGRASLYKSVDGGQTWQHAASGLNPEAGITAIVFDPTDPAKAIYLADMFSGVYRSADGGATWKSTNKGLSNRAVNALALSADGQHLYAATEGGGTFRLDLNGQPPAPAPAPTAVPTSTPAQTSLPASPVPATPTLAPTEPAPSVPAALTATAPPSKSGGGLPCGSMALAPLGLVLIASRIRRRCV